jgi:hypothetical protein
MSLFFGKSIQTVFIGDICDPLENDLGSLGGFRAFHRPLDNGLQ